MPYTTTIPRGLSGRIIKLVYCPATVLLLGAPVFLNASALTGHMAVRSAGSESVAIDEIAADFDFADGVTGGSWSLAKAIATSGTELSPNRWGARSRFMNLAGIPEVIAQPAAPDADSAAAALPGRTYVRRSPEATRDREITRAPAVSRLGRSDKEVDHLMEEPPPVPGTAPNVGASFSAPGKTFSAPSIAATNEVVLGDFDASDAVPEPGSLSMLVLGCGFVTSSIAYRRYKSHTIFAHRELS